MPSHKLAAFQELSRLTDYKRGTGLPGKVWFELKSIHLEQLDAQDSRNEIARSSGLRNAIAFPVRDKGTFYGVLEIFVEKPGEWNVRMLESIGRQMGQFLSRKEADQSRERLANIVELSSDAILLLSAGGEIIGWNHGAECTFGYRPAQMIGKNFSVLIPGDCDEEFIHLLHANLKSGSRVDGYETTLLSASGKKVDVSVYAIPWFTNSGSYDGCSLTMHNLTERKEAERNVGDFYSIVSHELRTPLTSIRGALGLIESRTVEPGSHECDELIAVARLSADRLIRLVNDILDLKKIEAGKMELNKCRIPISELVSCALTALQGLSKESGVSICSSSSINEEACINADFDKITQVITNLVSNAIKFSPPGASVRVDSSASGKNVKFSIIDQGPGIAEEDILKIFDKFQQLASSVTCGGTGLGLAICKAIVEEHGGQIGVASEFSKGSIFWFELPLVADQELPVASEPNPGEKQIFFPNAKYFELQFADSDSSLI
jgi:PAS domain S-box-containing protein